VTTHPTPTKFERHADVLIPVDPNRITFGIEIECLLPDEYVERHNVHMGGYHTNSRFMPAPFSNWAITSDGSLVSERGFRACEIVSPVLTGLAGIRETAAIYEHLQANGFKVNDSCGAHVHIGLKSLLGGRINDEKLGARVIRRLVNLVSQHEFGLVAITGNRRRLRNHYCQSIKSLGSFSLDETRTITRVLSKAEDADRYHMLNLKNLNTDKQTIEFRVFAGTTLPEHAVSYIFTAMGLCQRACEVPAGPTFNPDDTHTDFGDEAIALQRRLGWYNGKKYGVPAGANRLFHAARKAQLAAVAQFVLLAR
jgi:hypothetical protein